MESHLHSLSMAVQLGKPRTSVTVTQRCTWRNQVICHKNMPCEASRWQRTLFSIKLSKVILQIDTSALTTMLASMALWRSKLSQLSIPSLPAQRAWLRDLLKVPNRLKASASQSLRIIQPHTSRNIWSPKRITSNLISPASLLSIPQLAIYDYFKVKLYFLIVDQKFKLI